MVRYFVFAILGTFLSSFLGVVSPAFGKTLPKISKKKAATIAKKDDVSEKKPNNQNSLISNPQKISPQQTLGKDNSMGSTNPQDTDIDNGKAKKTVPIDARRLKDHKFTEAVRYIKEHPNTRFKLQNTTIDPAFLLPLLTALKEAQVLDKIKDIGFVMLNSANGKILDEGIFLQKILPFLEHLDGLELLCLGATDKIVKAISKKIPNLKSLSLFGPGITNETAIHLTKECPNLIKIHLLNSQISSPGIQTLTNNFPKLETLGISGSNLKDSDFISVGTGKPNLRSISMVGHNFKDMATITTLLKIMTKLHTLDISETNVTDAVAKSIAETKGLKNLNISDTKITKEGVKEIVQNLDLTTFKINNLTSISDNELEIIAKSQPGLKKFHFSGTSFSDSGLIDVIWDLKKLNDVTLIPISGSKWILSEAVSRALVRKKTKIQYLHIQADRLPETLRMKLENGIPNIRIEYQ
ncbi:MAG: hypothetical protein ACOH2E_01250 [Candidatus Paracaedibacter sp.]